jgi:Clostripain family/FlgD Ig-like domain
MVFSRRSAASGLFLAAMILSFGGVLDTQAANPQAGVYFPTESAGLLPDGVGVSPGMTPDLDGIFSAEPPEKADRHWTYLMYNCADFEGGDAMELFLPEMYSTATIDVLVLLDAYDGPAMLLHVSGPNTVMGLENWGEVDMGSPDVLQQFIEYGKTNFPADRYLLAGYGHGSHYAGACVDYHLPEGDGHSIMWWEGFRSGITAAGGVDILAFTAPCTVTPLEGLSQLQDSVDVMIGSEDLSFYAIWYGMMDQVRVMLSTQPELTTIEVATNIVQWVGDNVAWFGPDHTIDAIDPVLAGAVVPPVHDLATYLMSNMTRLHGDVLQARADCYELANHYYADYTAVDLISLLEHLALRIPEPAVLQATSEAIAAAEAAMIAMANGTSQSEAHGLSIYFPQTEARFTTYYLSCDLDFVTDTAWDEFLFAYFAGATPSAVPSAISREGLLPNWPNPFNPSTNIAFELVEAGPVDLSIHDVAGRRVGTLGAGRVFDIGVNTVRWDGTDYQGHVVPSGVYFVHLQTKNAQYLNKVVLVK